ncbi:hypothetical protein D3C86_1747240 [compost metagenome]
MLETGVDSGLGVQGDDSHGVLVEAQGGVDQAPDVDVLPGGDLGSGNEGIGLSGGDDDPVFEIE